MTGGDTFRIEFSVSIEIPSGNPRGGGGGGGRKLNNLQEQTVLTSSLCPWPPRRRCLLRGFQAYTSTLERPTFLNSRRITPSRTPLGIPRRKWRLFLWQRSHLPSNVPELFLFGGPVLSAVALTPRLFSEV